MHEQPGWQNTKPPALEDEVIIVIVVSAITITATACYNCIAAGIATIKQSQHRGAVPVTPCFCVPSTLLMGQHRVVSSGEVSQDGSSALHPIQTIWLGGVWEVGKVTLGWQRLGEAPEVLCCPPPGSQ